MNFTAPKKTIMKKNIIITAGVICISILFACTSHKPNNKIKESNEINLENITKDMPYDFTATFDLNEYDLDSLLTELAKELYDIDFTDPGNEWNRPPKDSPDAPAGEASITFDIRLNLSDKVLTIAPIADLTTELFENNKDDGQKAAGSLTDYGTCTAQSCVEEAMRTAITELSHDLPPEKCLNIRIKQTASQVRVCARLINC
jgi:hypothetical protein